jgi:exosortase A
VAEASALSFNRPAVSAPPLIAIGSGLCALLVLYWQTAVTAVEQWHSSSAYSYGYLIAPIVMFLIWRDRRQLAQEHVQPTMLGVAVTVLFGAAWLAADFLSIAEGRHLAFVGMIQGIVLAVVGLRIYRRIAFPMLYLFLMVPTGTFLLGPLQRLSHAGSVWLIKLSGIPVFAEGTFIQVPEGGFVVEPGCAGLNFLLTALALSLLYGKLTYASLRARTLCVATALGVAIAANIMRIYVIIVLTQVTHRKLDIADDHLLYGWGFFALIMLAMMWIGGRFATPPAAKPNDPEREPSASVSTARLGGAVAAVVIFAAIPPALAAITAANPIASAVVMPDSIGPWQRVTGDAVVWRPTSGEGAALGEARYEWNGARADVAIVAYRAQANGQEAASADNQPASPPWSTMSHGAAIVETGTASVPVSETVVRNGQTLRSVLSWYDSAGCATTSRLRAKVCAALARAHGHAAPGAFIAISADRDNDGIADAALVALARELVSAGPSRFLTKPLTTSGE